MCKIVNSNISEVTDVIWSEHSFSKYPGWFIQPNLPKNAETCYNLDELTLDQWFRRYIPRFWWKLLGLDDTNLGSHDKLLSSDDKILGSDDKL